MQTERERERPKAVALGRFRGIGGTCVRVAVGLLEAVL